MIKVTWDEKVCQHAGECVGSLPQVFKIDNSGLVIHVDQAPEEEIIEVVDRCPSGALRVHND
ncbi:MAG: (4Fe-4S)-binding protein [Gammaproteobacteria bacterium]|jgi:uncharacterized Fe-S cluster protein YjdI